MTKESDLSASWLRGFEVAQAASETSTVTQTGMKLGAALFSGNRLLSIGCNEWGKASTKYSQHKGYNRNLHAEVAALTRRKHYDNGQNLILYVSRTKTDSKKRIFSRGCSRPCARCMEAIRDYGVKKVRFYNEQGNPTEIKL